MKSLKMMLAIAAVSAMLAMSAYAQVPAPAQPKPATPPPVAAPQKPSTAPAPQPPRPFPEGAKFALVDIQIVASQSAEGKAATAKLDELRKKKNTELQSKATALKAMQDKLSAGGSVLNDQTRTQLEKDIEKATRDLQFAQQDAQTEVQDLTNQLQGEFQEKLNPILEQVRVDKGLLMIFSSRDAGIVAADLGLDLSEEVVKRFDAATKTAPKK
jgi:outer membrane protein